MRRPLVKRLLIAVLVIAGMIAAGWFGGRYPLARWAVRRGLDAAGLQPSTFQIETVGLGSLRLANLSVGTRPWLEVGSIDVVFTLRDLVAGRVGSVRLDGVRWMVDARNDAIDWGYTSITSGDSATATFDLPVDQVQVTDSAVHIVLKEAAHEVQLVARLQRTGKGTASVELDLSALGRTAALAGNVTSNDQQLVVELDGHAENVEASPGSADTIDATPTGTRPRASGKARFTRDSGGDTQLQFNVALDSITEKAGDTSVMLAHADIAAQATLDKNGLTALTGSLKAQGLRAGEVTFKTADITVSKPDGSALDVKIAASGEGWELPESRGSVRWESENSGGDSLPFATIFTVALQTDRPISVNLEEAAVSGLIQSVVASAQLRRDASGIQVMDGRLSLTGGSLQAGDLNLSDAQAEVLSHGTQSLEMTSFRAIVNDGSTVTAEPFVWHFDTPRVQTRVTVSDLSLEHWLPIISSKRASGEGRISGDAEVAIDWSSGTVKLAELRGSLRADPEHGFIQVADAESLGELLEKQDPRFATDEVMQAVRDKIISALRDFAYKKLTVDLSRRGDRTVALTYLSGFGRHGEDPQGINLTLDLHVQDAFLDLATRIAAKSRVKEAARGALDEFFQGVPAAQEDPR